MIKSKKKCLCEGCRYPPWSHGYCRVHQKMRTDAKWLKSLESARNKRKRPAKKTPVRRPIRHRAPRRAAQYAQYRIDRDEFLSRPENQMCRVYPWLEATDIHHMKGKIEDLLLDQRWWLPVSRLAHDKIELNPDWAKENGYSIDRES